MSMTIFGSLDIGIAVAGLTLILAMAISHLFKRFIGLGVFSVAVALALYFHLIDWVGLAFTLVYGALCFQFSFKKKGYANTIYGLLILVMSALFMLHIVPGFNNPPIIDKIAVSANAPLYTQYLNFDKAVAGFFLLIFVISSPPKVSYEGYLSSIIACSFSFGVAILLAVTSGLVEYDLKLPSYILIWALLNLFITTYAEEAYFRGFVQTALFRLYSGTRWQEALTCLTSGLVFGLAHFPAGIAYVAVASVLGTSYAYGYLRTGNILVPIVGHFLFNLLHFTFFTYQFIA